MYQVVNKISVLLAMSILLVACQSEPTNSAGWQQPLTLWQPQSELQIEDISLLPNRLPEKGADRVIVSERDGVLLLDGQGNTVAQHPGSFERLDLRVADGRVLLATVDRDRQQVMLLASERSTERWQSPAWLPTLPYDVEGLCLYQQQHQIFVFILGSEGQGSQFLVASDGQWLPQVHRVRDIGVPPGAEYCQVDDLGARLYVSEPGTGLWQYPAGPEAELTREPVAMRQPFGVLSHGADALSLSSQGILVLDADAQQLHLVAGSGHESWSLTAGTDKSIPAFQGVELVSSRQIDGAIELVLLAGENRILQGVLKPNNVGTEIASAPAVVQEVMPVVETEPVNKRGDAADDPAIWVNSNDVSLSRVLGTNKQEGLLVYDLQGHRIQRFPTGRLNNVDVRYGPDFDVAMASNRDDNSISVYRISHEDGLLSYAGDVPTELTDIYGFCLYQPQPGIWHAFANDKDGTYLQIQVAFADGIPRGKVLRRFKLETQPEGCVADDTDHRLFVGEEALGVWMLDARADQPTDRTLIVKVGGVLHADVEGLALYHDAAGEQRFLVVSSQGNDSYVVLDSVEPFAVRGVFRVGMNAVAGIDGASETDGLEVTATGLGKPFEQGLLVVQDGRNRLPEENQNFKLVPWSSIQDVIEHHRD